MVSASADSSVHVVTVPEGLRARSEWFRILRANLRLILLLQALHLFGSSLLHSSRCYWHSWRNCTDDGCYSQAHDAPLSIYQVDTIVHAVFHTKTLANSPGPVLFSSYSLSCIQYFPPSYNIQVFRSVQKRRSILAKRNLMQTCATHCHLGIKIKTFGINHSNSVSIRRSKCKHMLTCTLICATMRS